MTREDFIRISGLSLAGTLVGLPALGSVNPPIKGEGNMTIQQVIDLIIDAVGVEPLQDTVDTIKIGDPSMTCTGVVSTFLDTAEIIQNTADIGANLILSHEPTFYNHLDKVEWLEEDPVYQFKRRLLEENQIVVWRFHDYWHRHEPDGIIHGLLTKIGWTNYLDDSRERVCVIPKTSLINLGQFFKEKLNLKRPFIVGDPNLECGRVGFLPGSYGGRTQIGMLEEDIDVLVVGEIDEWETSEYIRDATFAGMKKGLIILGHAPSEGPGMKYAAEWLRSKIPSVPVYYELTTDAFIPI